MPQVKLSQIPIVLYASTSELIMSVPNWDLSPHSARSRSDYSEKAFRNPVWQLQFLYGERPLGGFLSPRIGISLKQTGRVGRVNSLITIR
jgi:hypothetical protein